MEIQKHGCNYILKCSQFLSGAANVITRPRGNKNSNATAQNQLRYSPNVSFITNLRQNETFLTLTSRIFQRWGKLNSRSPLQL
jgi:hypothetical protein